MRTTSRAFRILTAALFLFVSGSPAANAGQIQPDTPTGLTHKNPSVLGIGAEFELIDGVWSGQTVTQYAWYYQESCSATTSSMIRNQNGKTFTIPSTSIELLTTSGLIQVTLTTGSVIWGTSGFGGAGDFGSSPSPKFEIGVGFCPTSNSNQGSSGTSATTTADVARPYTGPVLNTPAVTSSIPAGGKVVIPGSNLSGVSAVEIGGTGATVVVNSDGELEITVPAELAPGTYDLVVVSDSGRLTVQDAIRVSAAAANSTTSKATPSTKRLDEDRAKVWVFDVVGAGKVQILVNGKEIAWIRTTDASNPKLTGGYLVRTVQLSAGKNVIEILVDGKRERRTVYSN